MTRGTIGRGGQRVGSRGGVRGFVRAVPSVLSLATWRIDASSLMNTAQLAPNLVTPGTLDAQNGSTGGSDTNDTVLSPIGYWLHGSDDSLQVADNAALDFAADESLTVVDVYRMIDTPATATRFGLCKGGVLGAGYSTLATSGRLVGFGINDGSESVVASSDAQEVGALLRVVGVRDVDADEIRLYVNGVLVDTAEDTTTGTLANSDVLGTGLATSSLVCRRYASQVYRQALTGPQIAALDGLLVAAVPDETHPQIGDVTTANSNSTAGVTVTLPVHNAGDLLVLAVSKQGSATSVSTPSGWTAQVAQGSTGGSECDLHIFTTTGDGEAGTVEAVQSAGTNRLVASVTALRGAGYGTDASDGNSATSAVVSPTVATTEGGAGGLLLTFVASRTVVTAPTGFASLVNVNREGTLYLACAFDADGTYTNPSGTLTWGNTAKWAAATVEIVSA